MEKPGEDRIVLINIGTNLARANTGVFRKCELCAGSAEMNCIMP
jgi:hypothetical protein